MQKAKDAGMIIDSKCLNLIMKYTEDQWDKKIAKQNNGLMGRAENEKLIAAHK